MFVSFTSMFTTMGANCLLSYVLVSLLTCAYVTSGSPRVETTCGRLVGKYSMTRNNRTICTFLGIPYAKPPIGCRRFMAPEEPDCWEGVRNASVEGAMCIQQFIGLKSIQTLVTGSEDCLYLNVYTPEISPKEPFPVICFIHGGGFQGGSSEEKYYGPQYILDKDIVLVTCNYRLGPMGFSATCDGTISGNMGLKDQSMALRWIQENIRYFGGNPHSVSLMGQSAGACSVHYHMYSEMSKGQFHRGILQSGCVYNDFAYVDIEVLDARTHRLAEMVNCPTENNEEMLKCLQYVNATELVQNSVKFVEWDVDPLNLWVPTSERFKEGAFMTKHPRYFEKHSDKPMMIGFNGAEGATKIYSMFYGNMSETFKQWNDHFCPLTAMSLLYKHTASEPDYVTKQVREYYFGDAKVITPQMATQIIKLYSMSWFVYGILKTVELHEGPLYCYIYNEISSFSVIQKLYQSEQYWGPCHGDEVLNEYSYGGLGEMRHQLDSGYLNFSIKFLDHVAHFATYSNPSTPCVVWEPSKNDVNKYMDISNDGFHMTDKLSCELESEYKFWKNIFKFIYKIE